MICQRCIQTQCSIRFASSPLSLVSFCWTEFSSEMKEGKMKDGLIKGWGDGRIREWVTASTVEEYEYEARFM